MKLIDKKVRMALSGCQIYLTAKMRQDIERAYPQYRLVEVTPKYPLPKGQKAYTIENSPT